MQLCYCETSDESHLRIIEEWRSLIVGRGAVAELASRTKAGLLGDRCAKSTCPKQIVSIAMRKQGVSAR